MTTRRHYLREWRKFRKMTQEQVIDLLVAMNDPLLPTTGASLSRIESGGQIYTQRILEALAQIYETEEAHLLSHNPLKEGEVVEFIPRYLSKPEKDRAIAVLQALFKTGPA